MTQYIKPSTDLSHANLEDLHRRGKKWRRRCPKHRCQIVSLPVLATSALELALQGVGDGEKCAPSGTEHEMVRLCCPAQKYCSLTEER